LAKLNDFIESISALFIEIAPYLILGFIISGVLYIFTSKEMISNNVGTPGFMSSFKASILGVPMPLCSCGVIPVAASMYKRGASKGATLSFLISTPQTGIDSILITLNQMGVQFAIIRPIIALITGVIGGLFGDWGGNKDYQTKTQIKHTHQSKTIIDGLKYAFITLPKDLINPFMKGLIISGIIAVLLPEGFFIKNNLTGITGMIIIALASVPMYVCATASVPIAMSLIIQGGLEPGAAFVFLMAGPATNAATISVIMNSLGKKIVYIYVSVIFVSAIISGLLINAYQHLIELPIHLSHNHTHNIFWNVFSDMSVFLMLIIVWYTIIGNPFINKSKIKESDVIKNFDLTLIVKGMTCNHCKETAMSAIEDCQGIEKVEIDLESGKTMISGKTIDEKEIIESINSVGFSVSKLS
tara:strand:+ start:7664 stop:8905 length:1242 start_codon:yes stop_codon:yes gene_type:complete